jgi:hypothetical protein
MFARINTGGTTANDAELRRGSLPGPFMDLVIELATLPEFEKITPISKANIDKREREELVTRFFAYFEKFNPQLEDGRGDIPTYKESPRTFFFTFVKEMNESIKKEMDIGGESNIATKMRMEFHQMLSFVAKKSPNGFTKSKTGNQVPRVRFEAIAVGTALALREDPSLFDRVFDVTPLLESTPFSTVTKSDAANVKSKLLGRIRLVKDWVVKQ